MTAAIKRGAVAVNGEPVQSFNHPVDPAGDVVTIEGTRVSLAAERAVYIMLNKPAGVVSSTTDQRGGTTVIDILPGSIVAYACTRSAASTRTRRACYSSPTTAT